MIEFVGCAVSAPKKKFEIAPGVFAGPTEKSVVEIGGRREEGDS
jgi:hypothetical protein